jgi:hypothetical protein
MTTAFRRVLGVTPSEWMRMMVGRSCLGSTDRSVSESSVASSISRYLRFHAALGRRDDRWRRRLDRLGVGLASRRS